MSRGLGNVTSTIKRLPSNVEGEQMSDDLSERCRRLNERFMAKHKEACDQGVSDDDINDWIAQADPTLADEIGEAMGLVMMGAEESRAIEDKIAALPPDWLDRVKRPLEGEQ
jgi:hypothetical protein